MSKITDDEPKYECQSCEKRFHQVTLHRCGAGAEWKEIETDKDDD